MSFPYDYEVHFGSEHSFSDCVISPEVKSESNSSDSNTDAPNPPTPPSTDSEGA